MAVLHEAVAQVAEERPGARGLAKQPGLRVGAGAVGLVGEQQAAEITLGSLLALAISRSKPFASTGRWRIVVASVDPLQRAMGGPGPQQGAVNGEVLRAQQRLDLRCGKQQLQKLGHELLVEQPVPVLGERRRMPDRIVRVEADEPAEEQVVVQLLHEHPLRADAVDRLQQQGQQQLLRRDGWPAADPLGVEPAERRIQPIEGLIGQPAHLP